MKIYKTTEYFGITRAEAAERINECDTREEAKVLDSGLEHYFYETLKGLEVDYNSEWKKNHTNKYGYDVLLFEFVADNDNHNKYCMVFV